MRIVKVEPSRRIKGRWLVWMEDGSLIRVNESEVAAFSLYNGREIDERELLSVTEAASMSRVRERAIDLIAARPLSRRELTEKLTAKPFRRAKDGSEREPIATPEQAETVCDWLEELGYLNDGDYAKTVAAHYSRKGYGARKIQDELYRRGVPREYWDAALDAVRPAGEGVDAFLRTRFKGETPDAKELKRASDALRRRGFGWDEIKEGLRRYDA